VPRPFQYRAGSVIYFQGDAAAHIYILQSGKVNLNYEDVETGEAIHDLVQPGEFFGVKSALGRYPREENAIAIQDAGVMAFTVSEFEQLATANTRIIMKMLKVFSNQLRRIHRQVANIVEQTEEVSPEAGLFSIGEYYLKNKRFQQAKYIFSRYLTYYPSGRNAAAAAKNLEAAETGGGAAAMPQAAARSSAPVTPSSVPDASSLSQGGAPANLGDAAKAYYDAVSMLSQEKYQQAYLSFQKIMDAHQDEEYVAKSAYELGRCLYLLGEIRRVH